MLLLIPFPQYMGTWYDIESYPVPFQGGACPTATYTLTDAGVDVYNTQVVGQQLDTIRGTAVLATTDGSAKLNVTFPIAGTNRECNNLLSHRIPHTGSAWKCSQFFCGTINGL